MDHPPTAAALRRYWRSAWAYGVAAMLALPLIGVLIDAVGSPEDGPWALVIGALIGADAMASVAAVVTLFRAAKLRAVVGRHPWVARRWRAASHADSVLASLMLLPEEGRDETVLLLVSLRSHVLRGHPAEHVWVADGGGRWVAVAPPGGEPLLVGRRPWTAPGRRAARQRVLAAADAGPAALPVRSRRARVVLAAVWLFVAVALGVAVAVAPVPWRAGAEPIAPLPRQHASPPVPSALTLEPAGPLVIDPAHAERIVRAVWDLREDAVLDRQVAALESLETGPALWVDRVRAVEGWESPRPRGTEPADVTVVVPRQYRYPAHFLAQVRTTNWGVEEYGFLVFVRASSSDHWRLALETHWSTEPLEGWPFSYDADGFSVIRRSPTDLDPTHVHDLLAEYFQAWKDSGRPPTPDVFAQGGFTTATGEAMARHRNHRRQPNGRVEHWRFYGEPDPHHIWVYGTEHGVLVCGSVWHDVETEGARQRDDRVGWGPELRPGAYERLLRRGVVMSCVDVPHARGKLSVLGERGASRVIDSDPPGLDPVP